MVRHLALSLILLASSLAHATSVRTLGVTELTRSATLVVLGVADQGQSYWHGGRILTRTPIAIEEVWLGQQVPGNVVEITSLGGIVGGIGQVVSGATVLRPGSRVVLFLRAAGERLVPVELGQGVFYAEANAHGVVRVARDKRADTGHAASIPPSMTLDELRDQVAEARRAQ